jgi:hypothetical protein
VAAPSSRVSSQHAALPQEATSTGVEQDFEEIYAAQPTQASISSWAWIAFATLAGAVNGYLWKSNSRVALASMTGRREALMTGVAAAGMASSPAFAAYGDAANVFGKTKEVDQKFTIEGAGWKGNLPAKFNPSKERDLPNTVARWEDNFDAVNNATVCVSDVGKNSVTELGDLDNVLKNVVTPLLGEQAYEGTSLSEGGFVPGKFSTASIIDQSSTTKNGKTYYLYELLTRTADGNEGGRHQLFSVSCANGKLIVFKLQAGDKRWFKGLERPLRSSLVDFTSA